MPLPTSPEPPEALRELPNVGIAVSLNCSTQELPVGLMTLSRQEQPFPSEDGRGAWCVGGAEQWTAARSARYGTPEHNIHSWCGSQVVL